MAKYSIPKLESKSFRGWTFVLIAGVVLTALALLDRGGLGEFGISDNSTGCQLAVSAEELNVRNGPSEDATLGETLMIGATVDGTPVVTDGYRQLEGGNWAADQFLTPLPGSNCG